MNNQEKINKIREKCIAANPEIVELKEGCQVIVGDGKLRHTIYGINDGNKRFMAFLNKPFREDLLANTFYDCEFSGDAEGVEILGRPIRIADVLLSHRMKYSEAGYIEYNRETVSIVDGAFAWNLRADELEQQPEETVDFIYQLLQ
jgi:hypothetical protein